MSSGISKALVLRGLKQCREGSLEIACGGQHHRFGQQSGDVQATLAVHDDRFFRRVLLGGDVGLGDSYVDGEWSSPDLANVVRFAVRNIDRMDRDGGLLSTLSRLRNRFRRPRRTNNPSDSRENISFHYDLGNEFYQLFLDPTLMYSCAIFGAPDESLESAQQRKLARIAESLDLRPRDHLLEIGTGWGGFALYAAQNYGCHVTTTTISRRQYEYAKQALDRAGEAGTRVRLLFEDYRDLRGSYDKIVSIEMFEAVGVEHYDDFFGSCDRVLTPGGAMLLQTITMNERRFAAHVRAPFLSASRDARVCMSTSCMKSGYTTPPRCGIGGSVFSIGSTTSAAWVSTSGSFAPGNIIWRAAKELSSRSTSATRRY
jgi:cyclopropane-fatty-acyl-phospholipid synthase